MEKTEENDKSNLKLKSVSKPGGSFGIHSLNNFREVGSYTWIAREITDEMGFPNCVKDTDDCHYCEGQLFVMRHGGTEETNQSTDSFGQVLTMINHETGNTNIFTRAVHPLDSNEWQPWQMVATGDPKLIAENNSINEVLSALRQQVENDSKRIETAESSLLASSTARFDRIEENENTIKLGEVDVLKEVVYYRPANKFVAADNAGNYWNTWQGMDAYMNGANIREDKVYLCESKVYISTNSCLIQINNSLVLQGIEELIALCLGDGQSHTLGIRQVVKSSGRISLADVTLGVDHYIDAGIPDSYPTGVKEYWYKSAYEGVYYIFYIRVNWDLIRDVPFSTDIPTETITLNLMPYAFSVVGSNLLNMLQTLNYDIIEVTKYNSDGVVKELRIVWRDGTESVATFDDYNADILEYNTLTAKYNDYIQVVQVCEYNEIGESTKRITTIKNV